MESSAKTVFFQDMKEDTTNDDKNCHFIENQDDIPETFQLYDKEGLVSFK